MSGWVQSPFFETFFLHLGNPSVVGWCVNESAGEVCIAAGKLHEGIA